MKRARKLLPWGMAVAAVAAALSACGSEPVMTAPPVDTAPKPGTPPVTPQAQGQAQPGGATARDGGPAPTGTENLPPLPLKEFQERDFSETDTSRDPFRNFAAVFARQLKSTATVQRKALVDRYALDELKLIGIVTRAPARALLTDPAGTGWVAKVGDFVGKSELVHSGGPTGIDVAVNWRVDRIRHNDVVFVREDPSHPEIPPTTRIMALRTPEEEAGLVKNR
jgi:type IV pilus assembly protein PilP